MSLFSSPFARRTLGFMLAGAVVLTAIVAASIWLPSRTNNIAEEAARLRDIRTLSASTLESLLNAETSQRGFLLTEDEAYLQPYEAAVPQLRSNVQKLSTLTANDTTDSQTVDQINAVATAKFAELAQTIELARAEHRDAALAIVRTDQGKQLMDEARDQLRPLTKSSGGTSTPMGASEGSSSGTMTNGSGVESSSQGDAAPKK